MLFIVFKYNVLQFLTNGSGPHVSLSVLLAILEASLMDEPCDWDLCPEVSPPSSLSNIISRTEKKNNTEASATVPISTTCETAEQCAPAKLKKTVITGKGDAISTPQAAVTRKQLQEALPKIPSLSSFKTCRSRNMTLDEAERDFESFITTGLGRSVEIIREFRGRDVDSSDDQNTTYKDDNSAALPLSRASSTSSVSGSFSQQDNDMRSSSHDQGSVTECQTNEENKQIEFLAQPGSFQSTPSIKRESEVGHEIPEWRRRNEWKKTKEESGERRNISENRSKERSRHAEVTKFKDHGVNSVGSPGSCAEDKFSQSVMTPHSNQTKTHHKDPFGVQRQDRSPHENSKERVLTKSKEKAPVKTSDENEKRSKKRSKDKIPEKDIEEPDSEVEDEEGWDSKDYWRACYRAWKNFYSSTSPYPGFQQYYSVAPNWMAAYRMNAVYMETLMKH